MEMTSANSAGSPGAELQEQLRRFRATHPSKSLRVAGMDWEYIASGQGAETLVLLQGAAGVDEAAFQRVLRFEGSYRVITPTYPEAATTMSQLVAGVAGILAVEGAGRAHLYGHSLGAAVAQCLARAHPDRVGTLTLANIGLASRSRFALARILLRALSIIPASVVRALVAWRIRRGLAALPPAEQVFYQAYLDERAARYLTKERLLNQYRCMLDFIERCRVAAGDLAGWSGRILIIEAEDDTGWNAAERSQLKAAYPQAQVHTFRRAGHLAGAVRRAEYDAVIATFLEAAHPARPTAGEAGST